jgi:hypothetical protein
VSKSKRRANPAPQRVEITLVAVPGKCQVGYNRIASLDEVAREVADCLEEYSSDAVKGFRVTLVREMEEGE